MSKEEREEIARIIEPHLFQLRDKYQLNQWGHEKCGLALAKADQIIAARLAREALSQGSPPPYPKHGTMHVGLREPQRVLVEALERIGRMKLFPDDVINRNTLQAAIHLAEAALKSTTQEDGEP